VLALQLVRLDEGVLRVKKKPRLYLPPEEHPPAARCPACKKAPYCPECYGHHDPLVQSVDVPKGPRPVRVVAVDGDGRVTGMIAGFPSVNGREDKDAAIAYAKENPGRRAAVEKRGTWFAPERWERFEVVGPFDEKGQPIHVRDEGADRRAAYLRRVAEAAAAREAAAQLQQERDAKDGKPVASPGRKGRSRRW
jgi:hypothetical protein